MAKATELPQPFITTVPLTAEAREQFIARLFTDELPNEGNVFVPGDDFYNGETRRREAKHMVALLCRWLGIKPGYIGLEFESGGGQIPDGRRHTIYIDNTTLENEFVLGGFLAYALTRYLVEERKQIHLPEPDQQAALLASSSIVFGLGLTIMNGINPTSSWLSYRLRHTTELLKEFPVSNYAHMTLKFLQKYRIDHISYSFALTPWASKHLGLHHIKRLSRAAADAKHQSRIANIKLAGITWLVLFTISIGTFLYTHQTRPLPSGIVEASRKADLLRGLTRTCNDRLAYDKQYADTSDLQTIRALSAEQLRCQSLQNQADTAQRQVDSQTN